MQYHAKASEGLCLWSPRGSEKNLYYTNISFSCLKSFHSFGDKVVLDILLPSVFWHEMIYLVTIV